MLAYSCTSLPHLESCGLTLTHLVTCAERTLVTPVSFHVHLEASLLKNLKPAEEENHAYVNLNPEKAQLSQTSVISKETWVAVGITLDEKERPH